MSKILVPFNMKKLGTPAGNPPAGFLYLYFKTADGKLYQKDEAGVESLVTGSGGSPSDAAGGDLAGNYPNPTLAAIHALAGTYNNPAVTIDNKGRVTNISARTFTRKRFFPSEAMSTLGTSTRTYSATTGTSFISLGGANADIQNCSLNFDIPDDYVSGGKFRIWWTSLTSTANIKINSTVSQRAVGEDLLTTTGSELTSFTFAGTTQYLLQMLNIPIALALAPAKSLMIKLNRDGSDAADTATNINFYIYGVSFEYTAKD